MSKLPAIIDNRHDNTVLTALQTLLPNLKLHEAKKRGGGSISIPLLESNDICLSNWLAIGQAVEQVLADIADAPDEIYVAKTELDQWYMWVIKEGADVFPDVEAPGPYVVAARGEEA